MRKNKDENKRKRKVKVIELYTVLIMLSTLFMSIAFAEITDIKLNITGEVTAKVQSGIFISNVEKSAETGALSDEIKYYKGTTLSSSVELSSATNSSITYKVTLHNNSSQKNYFKGVAIVEEAYDNKNITYSLDGLKEYITTIDEKETKGFNLIFKYANGVTPSASQILNSMLNFEFSTDMVEFTLDGIKYSAPKGATWAQFINSEYNTYDFTIANNKVYASTGEQIYLLDKEVKNTDVIKGNTAYNYKPELTLDKESIEVELESGSTATQTLTATLTNVPESEVTNIKWTSSNKDVAEVVGNGNTATLTLKAAGTAEITVNYGELSETCKVTVTEKTITLDKTTITKEIESGGTATETLTATTQNISGDLTWTSSDTSVVEVVGNGNTATLTIKAAGTATITVSYGTISATCNVTVTEAMIEDELAGTWTFNDTLTIDSEFTYYLDFETSGGVPCSGIKSWCELIYDGKNIVRTCWYVEFLEFGEIWDTKWDDGWVNRQNSVIVISSKLSEVENGDALLGWLEENATKHE